MKKLLIFINIIFIFLFSSCSNEKDINTVQQIIPVEVKTLNVEKSDSSISYVGIINSDVIKKYAFKTSGKIKSINVKIGQAVNVGDILIELDKSDLQFQVDAAKSQTEASYAQYQKALSGAQSEDINAAKLNVEKAQAGYDFAQKTYNDIKKLYDEDAISETNFKEAELNLNLVSMELEQAQELLKKAESGARKEDISSAKSQYELAKTSYDAIIKLYNEAMIVSDVAGYVTDILYEIGEIVPQGYPAVLVQSKNQIISIGVTQEDIDKIVIGMEAKININDVLYNGKIINISQTPDETSRTFNIDIAITDENKKFYIGSIGKVEIITGTTENIWLEISYILNDGEDYVYIVENNIVVRKNIKINKIDNDKASVNGLSNNDVLVINGQHQIKDGYVVEVKK